MHKQINSDDSSDLALKFACTLQTMSLEQRFQQKNIEFIERFFVETFIEMDQRGCLKAQERPLINLLIASHLATYPPTPPHTESLGVKYEENQEDYLFILHQSQKQDIVEQSPSLSRKKQSFHNQENNLEIIRSSQKSHQIFTDLFNISMKTLHLYPIIKSFCLSMKVWTIESFGKYGIAVFVYKLIVIKNFYPNYFPAIIKQFTKRIGQFNEQERMTTVEVYAKQILSPRYLNCIRIYVETDDIKAAAYQLYLSPNCNSNENKIKDFEDYQIQIKAQALELELKKKQNNQKMQKFKKYLKPFKFIKKKEQKQYQQFCPWTSNKIKKKNSCSTNLDANVVSKKILLNWTKIIEDTCIMKIQQIGKNSSIIRAHPQKQGKQLHQKKNQFLNHSPHTKSKSDDSSDLALKFACTLQTMSLEQRFQQKNIEFIERFFVETFIEMDQRGCLKAQERPLINLLIASHLATYPPTPPHTESLGVKYEENQEDYLFIPHQNMKIDQNCQVSSSAHRKLFNLLIDSMKRLRIYKQIRLFCMKENAWSAQVTIASFLQKLIALKILLPKYFIGIISQFLEEVEQCNKIYPITANDFYVKQILIPRYLNCVRIYVENDDIEAAASQIYIISTTNSRKIHTFVDYQIQMKQKAFQIGLRKKNSHKRLRPRKQLEDEQYDLIMENQKHFPYF